MRNGTPMQRLRDRERISLTPERRAAVAERRLEMQAEGAAETVLGNRPFEIVNVEGTDVAPFLGKTDGEKLVDPTGLGDDVVETAAVLADAITAEGSTFTAASLDVTGTSEITVQSVTYTTTGGALEVRANFFLTVWHPTAGDVNATVRMYRDATEIYEQEFPAINGDLLQGWMTPAVIEQPAAGEYDYTVTVQVDVSNTNTAEAVSRLLSVREFKR